jgi:mono/diheme cytochrome c family protein
MNREPEAKSRKQDAASSSLRNRIGVGFFAAAVAFLVIAITFALWSGKKSLADPDDSAQVARGKPVYERYCAACHGAALEGQPSWQVKLPSGRLPAPPHDASGHTWHHPDSVLFGITKHGLVPGKYAPPGYQSDMPPFDIALSDDDIWAVLAYIKSSWPTDIRKAQHAMTWKLDRR